MSKDAAPPTVQEPAKFAYRDVPHAPIIFFDLAPNFSNRDGVVGVSLCAVRHVATTGLAPEADFVVVANLRCTIPAAQNLRQALDDALLLATKYEGQKN